MLETNLDDCTGEKLAYCQGLLMQAGALDASFSPLYMKKNRPAWLLRVICRQEDAEALSRIIFRKTTALGVRTSVQQRRIMKRWPGIVTEYESAAKLAEASGLSLDEIYRKAERSMD